MLRSKNFSMDKLPDVSIAGWKAIRAGHKAIQGSCDEARDAFRTLQANTDLTDEAKARIEQQIRTRAADSVAEACASVRERIKSAGTKLSEGLKKRQRQTDTTATEPLKIGDADSRAERLAIDGVNATRQLIQMFCRQEVDRSLDAALGEDAGALAVLYEQAVGRGDRLFLMTLEDYGLKRVMTEGSTAQRDVFAAVVQDQRDERLLVDLSEEALQIIDHTNQQLSHIPFLDAIEAEVKHANFNGTSVSLRTSKDLVPTVIDD